MNGGYQTLDLRTATPGDPVTIKGAFEAVKGSNGKTILVEDRDGQEVFAQSKEVNGDYVVTYLSAEGKTVKVTITDEDSVTTVIADDSGSIGQLQIAVNEINARVSAYEIGEPVTGRSPTDWTKSNPFEVNFDGYIRLMARSIETGDADEDIALCITDSSETDREIGRALPGTENTIYVKRGMEVWLTSTGTPGRANFYPLYD